MSDQKQDLNPAENQTPLQQVQEQQALQRENQETEQSPDTTPDVPGAGAPSDKIHHPQRQLYGEG